MSRTIKITKPANKATVVEVFENGISTELMAINQNVDFFSDQNFVIFPDHNALDKLRLSPSTLHADTITLLSIPTTAEELLVAMVGQDFFNSN